MSCASCWSARSLVLRKRGEAVGVLVVPCASAPDDTHAPERVSRLRLPPRLLDAIVVTSVLIWRMGE